MSSSCAVGNQSHWGGAGGKPDYISACCPLLCQMARTAYPRRSLVVPPHVRGKVSSHISSNMSSNMAPLVRFELG